MAKKTRKELKDIFSPSEKYQRIKPKDFGHLLDSAYLKDEDEGPTGPTGATGPTGPTGSKGETGPTGGAKVDVIGASLSPTSSGSTGEIKTDSIYLYVAVAKDSWIRFGPGSTSF